MIQVSNDDLLYEFQGPKYDHIKFLPTTTAVRNGVERKKKKLKKGQKKNNNPF